MEHRGADAAWPVAQHSRFELAPPRRFLLPALLLLLSEEPGYGYNLAKRPGGPALRPRRPPERLPCTCPARAGRPGRVVGRYAQGRPGPAGVRPDRRGRARPAGVDGGHQAGAGLPGPRAPPLRGDRNGRRRAGRGRGRVGRGDWASVVPGVGDVAHRTTPPRHPARRAGQAPARGDVQRAGRPGRPRAVPRRLDVRPVRRGPGSLGDPDRGPFHRRSDHLRRGGRHRRDRSRGPRRPGGAGAARRPRTWRSRSPACAPATASTTPSSSAGSTPAAIRSSPSTSGAAARSARPIGSTSTARSRSTAPPVPSRAR